MENEIVRFKDERFGAIRLIGRGGTPWFVGNDVARALGYSDANRAVRDHCKGGCILPVPSEGGVQQMKIIPESDVYRLVLRSKLAQAEAFQDWVVEEVLPSIRKHGAFFTNNVLDQALTDPRHMAELFNALADERDGRVEAEGKLHYLAPTVPYGTSSARTGRPRTQLVKPYWRDGWRRVKTTTETIEWQRALFD